MRDVLLILFGTIIGLASQHIYRKIMDRPIKLKLNRETVHIGLGKIEAFLNESDRFAHNYVIRDVVKERVKTIEKFYSLYEPVIHKNYLLSKPGITLDNLHDSKIWHGYYFEIGSDDIKSRRLTLMSLMDDNKVINLSNRKLIRWFEKLVEYPANNPHYPLSGPNTK